MRLFLCVALLAIASCPSSAANEEVSCGGQKRLKNGRVEKVAADKFELQCRKGFKLVGGGRRVEVECREGSWMQVEGENRPRCITRNKPKVKDSKKNRNKRHGSKRRRKFRMQNDEASKAESGGSDGQSEWIPYGNDVVGHEDDVIVVLGQEDQDDILKTGVYETTGGGGGEGIQYDDDEEYESYDGDYDGEGGGGEEDSRDEEEKADYGMYYDYDYGGGEEEGGEEETEEDNEIEDGHDHEDDKEEEVAEEEEERSNSYGGEEYEEEEEYEDENVDNYDDEEDYEEEEESSEDSDAEELLYRNYEILSEFYKTHFVDLRVLDTTCDPEQVPPPEIEHGVVKQYRTTDNILLPGKQYHEVEYMCDTGFRLSESSGKGFMFCQQSGWMGVHPYCEEDPYAEVTQDEGRGKESDDVEGCGEDHGCDQLCQVLEDGGRQCYCEEGFRLESETTCVDIDECEEGEEGICEQGCVNKPGTYTCTCSEGFQVGESGSCVDVNECVSNNGHGPCQDICTNTVGSYQCSCENLPGTVASGHDCEAMDMCSKDNGGCSHECYTTYGQSFCMCPSGYKLGEDWKTCVDVDECATMASVREEECGGAERCVNTEGSYKCVNSTEEEATHPVDPGVEGGGHLCDQGYEYDYEGSVCVDIDECRNGSAECGEGGECVNTEPGYECRCHQGYESDGDTCVDVDECQEDQPCGRNGDCENVAGSYECRCHEGYELSEDGECVDVDECRDRCTENGRCLNSEGGFTCECQRGFKLDEEGANCVDVDECREVVDRGGSRPCGRARCVNEPGSYSCHCRRQGFVFSHELGRCRRPDPCADETSTAPVCGDRGRCVADVASSAGYRCECEEGFHSADGGQSECVDLDECQDGGNNGGCDHHCENTVGSFRCLCRSGFREDPRNASRCVDFDECAEHTNSCQQKCVNSVGSYRCDCQDGYEVSKDDPAACVPVEVEEDLCRLPCSHGCGERGICKCPKGMILGPDRYTCKVVPSTGDPYQQTGCTPLPASDGLKLRCSRPVGEDYAYPRGTVCRGRCTVGYVPHEGRLRKKCSSNGEWSGTEGSCKRVYCPPVDLAAVDANLLVTPSTCSVDHSLVRQRCKFSCPEGFRLVGSRSARCRRNSEWKYNGGPPKCTRIRDAVTYGTTTTAAATITATTTTEATTTARTLPPRSYDYTTAATTQSYRTTTPFSLTSPYIYCPPDITRDLPAHSNTVHVRIPQPKTNVNWYDFVKATPAWAKKLEGELAMGKTLVTFQALSPISDESSSCSLSIHVRDTVPPRVYNCPKDFRAYLDEGQARRQIFWEEPVFSDNVKITHVMASKMPGQQFGQGHHRVVYQAADEDGNEAECTFHIDVLDATHLDMRKRRWVACRVGSTGRLIRLFVAHVPRGCWRIARNGGEGGGKV